MLKIISAWCFCWLVVVWIGLSGCSTNQKTFTQPEVKRGWIVNHTDHVYEIKLYSETEEKYMWQGYTKTVITWKQMAEQAPRRKYCSSEMADKNDKNTMPAFYANKSSFYKYFQDNVLNLLLSNGTYRLEAKIKGQEKVSLYQFVVDKNTPCKFTVDLE